MLNSDRNKIRIVKSTLLYLIIIVTSPQKVKNVSYSLYFSPRRKDHKRPQPLAKRV